MAVNKSPTLKWFAMSGKKSEPGWHPDSILQLAEDRFLNNVQSLEDAAQSAVLALASSPVYEANYKLTWWQWMFFPILSTRLYRLQLSIRQGNSTQSAQRIALQKTVAQLEFGKKAPPPHIILLVRQNILRNEFNHWQVRQAFNSLALRNRKNRLQLRMQPTNIHGVSVLVFWLFALFSGWMFWALIVDCFFTDRLPLPYNQFIVLFDACLLGTLAFYQFGYQWRLGERVMQRIWPVPTVHISG